MPDQEISEIPPITATFDKDECNCAADAIDKDLSTVAATSTIDGFGMLEIEYGKTFFLRKVIIHFLFFNDWFDPGLWCVQSVANFKDCVDHNSDVDVSVYQGEVKLKSCGTVQLTYGLEQSDQIYTLICNEVGDRVRLTKTSLNNLVMSEVIVIGAHIGKFRETATMYCDGVYERPGTAYRIARLLIANRIVEYHA